MDKSEPSDDQKLKSAEETAQRVLALLVTVGKVYDPERFVDWMKRYNLHQFLSPAEAAFVDDNHPTEKSVITFSWRSEAMVSLLWALNILPTMPPFNEPFNIYAIDEVLAALNDPLAFVSQVRLRDAQEICDMESHLYHQHWRVRDRDLGLNVGKSLEPRPDDPPIEQLNSGIVYERRYGLSWLAGWGEDWDNVSTDT
jgi:hypothetical protein